MVWLRSLGDRVRSADAWLVDLRKRTREVITGKPDTSDTGASSDPRGVCRSCGASYYLDGSGGYVSYRAAFSGEVRISGPISTEESISWVCPFCSQQETHPITAETEQWLADHDD